VPHIFDRKHITINKFSRRLRKLFDDVKKINKKNIDYFINNQLNCVRVCFVRITTLTKNKKIFENKYLNKLKQIA